MGSMLVCFVLCPNLKAQERGRARDFGVEIGILPTGYWNAITDVDSVLVGHTTLIRGDSIRSGVTVILPHKNNLYQDKVPAAVYVGNGYGKLAGSTQIEELGEIETPVALTNTLSIPAAVEGVVRFTLNQNGNERIGSVNGVAGETNDGFLNDIRGMHVKPSHVLDAIASARSGPVVEGCVGAGTGTVCFGFKGGIGTSSRKLPTELGGWTVGVLIQTNFGGVLQINGAPVGRELNRFAYKDRIPSQEDGSCMIVVATDAPLVHRNLKRLAARAVLGLARCGGFMSNGSGDYVIAFSTHPGCRIRTGAGQSVRTIPDVPNGRMSPLFLAVVEAVEEAVLNSLFCATTKTGKHGRSVEALPISDVLSICKKYNVLNWSRTLPPGKPQSEQE